MNPLVSRVRGTEKRWSAEYAALREQCLASGLNESLKCGHACYDLDGGGENLRAVRKSPAINEAT